jgi:serine/threonine protein kinase/archaellum component FlaC
MAALATGALGRAGAFPAPGRPSRPPGRVRHVTRAGIKYSREDVEVDRQIGEGSFGIVYSGTIEARKTGTVVLKRPKLTVEGAAELQEVEAWMNDRVSRDARGACADFLGSFRVSPDESYLNQSEGVIAKEGLWLVWRYEGDKTLAQFMAQPDYPAGIAKTLFGREGNLRGDAAVELEVTQAAMKQLFKNLNNVHRAGLVHRDIKPHNLVLTHSKSGDIITDPPKFKLIDLGACACFRTGMNFAPDETIMDPKYAPPEEFLIPSDDAPDIRKLFGPVALAAGSAAWLKHKPDRFDMYSAGIVMMQLALPSLRTNSGLVTFNKSLKRCGYDLFLWRDANKGQLSRSKTVVLDAGDGAGWDLARSLLRPRAYDEDAEVAAAVARNKARKGKSDDDLRRRDDGAPSARRASERGGSAAAPVLLRGPRGGGGDGREAADGRQGEARGRVLRGALRQFRRRGGGDAREATDAEASGLLEETAPENVLADMLGLEKRISKQQDLIMKQSTTIMRLRETGAPTEEIEKEQKTLERMKIGLQGLLRSFSFSQVEAKTTMVKAATEMQELAESAGVEPPPLEGFMQNIFGKKAASAAVGAADSVLDSILDVLKPNRTKTATDDAAAAAAAAPASRASDAEGAPKKSSGSSLEDDRAKDPAELRKRMDDIKNEMVAVAEQMAEMERRLLEQQEDLERRQARLERESGALGASEGYLAEEADREGKALTTAAGKPILREDIQNIEETKREIEEALNRIDGMQQAQKDLIE